MSVFELNKMADIYFFTAGILNKKRHWNVEGQLQSGAFYNGMLPLV